jgi:hypothetical protein
VRQTTRMPHGSFAGSFLVHRCHLATTPDDFSTQPNGNYLLARDQAGAELFVPCPLRVRFV